MTRLQQIVTWLQKSSAWEEECPSEDCWYFRRKKDGARIEINWFYAEFHFYRMEK